MLFQRGSLFKLTRLLRNHNRWLDLLALQRQHLLSKAKLPLPKTTTARTKSSQQTVLKSRKAPLQAQKLQATAECTTLTTKVKQESPSQVASRESITDTPKEPLLRSLFPKISAGLSAVGEEWRGFGMVQQTRKRLRVADRLNRISRDNSDLRHALSRLGN